MSLSFVAFDVETANSNRGSICAMGLTVVEAGKIKESHSWLSRPPDDIAWFDRFNTNLHGISADMVVDQPSFAKGLERALEIVDGRPVVAHNAGFDLSALRYACDSADIEWPTLTYGCSLVMSRLMLSLLSYRLPLVCRELEIPFDNHHDAGADALAAALVTLELARRQEARDLEDLVSSLGIRLGQLEPDRWRGCVRTWQSPAGLQRRVGPPPDANLGADPSHPFFGETIVFTGALSIHRREAWDAVAAFGATAEESVTKRTTMLVIGDGFTGHNVEDFTTGKASKAAKWLAKGHAIEVLNEAEFHELLSQRAEGFRS